MAGDSEIDYAAKRAATGGEAAETKFLTVHEVADLLQVPVSWVYGQLRERCTEPLPGYRIGKYWRFRASEILLWVESRKRRSRAA